MKTVLGPDSVRTLTSLRNLETTYSSLGEYHSAEELEVQVLEGMKRAFGPDMLIY
jgi:hypothetical protein